LQFDVSWPCIMHLNLKLQASNLKLTTMKKIKITQVKSVIDRPERQKKTMQALGLRKLHATVEKDATPQVLGMVEKVLHLVKVEEVAG
jgi:large subunit ribosomal protein L30